MNRGGLITAEWTRSTPMVIRTRVYFLYCSLMDIVQNISTLLDQEKIVHICGTMASEKSLLANFTNIFFLVAKKSTV